MYTKLANDFNTNAHVHDLVGDHSSVLGSLDMRQLNEHRQVPLEVSDVLNEQTRIVSHIASAR